MPSAETLFLDLKHITKEILLLITVGFVYAACGCITNIKVGHMHSALSTCKDEVSAGVCRPLQIDSIQECSETSEKRMASS